MSRANAHSVFSCQSGGRGKSSYSRPGYWRKGRCRAYRAETSNNANASCRRALTIYEFYHPETGFMTKVKEIGKRETGDGKNALRSGADQVEGIQDCQEDCKGGPVPYFRLRDYDTRR